MLVFPSANENLVGSKRVLQINSPTKYPKIQKGNESREHTTGYLGMICEARGKVQKGCPTLTISMAVGVHLIQISILWSVRVAIIFPTISPQSR